jgi:hypothetical protein
MYILVALPHGSVKARDAINRRLYEEFMIVETPIYRVFVIYNSIRLVLRVIGGENWSFKTR